LQLFLFLLPLQHMKRQALQNKQDVLLRMAFRARKVLGNFEKRAPDLNGNRTFFLNPCTFPMGTRIVAMLGSATCQIFILFHDLLHSLGATQPSRLLHFRNFFFSEKFFFFPSKPLCSNGFSWFLCIGSETVLKRSFSEVLRSRPNR